MFSSKTDKFARCPHIESCCRCWQLCANWRRRVSRAARPIFSSEKFTFVHRKQYSIHRAAATCSSSRFRFHSDEQDFHIFVHLAPARPSVECEPHAGHSSSPAHCYHMATFCQHFLVSRSFKSRNTRWHLSRLFLEQIPANSNGARCCSNIDICRLPTFTAPDETISLDSTQFGGIKHFFFRCQPLFVRCEECNYSQLFSFCSWWRLSNCRQPLVAPPYGR